MKSIITGLAGLGSIIMSALRAAAGFTCSIAAMPFNFLGNLFGGGRAAAAHQEQEAASASRQAAIAREAAADHDAAIVEQVTVLRRVAQAVARGRTPDQVDVDMLAPAVLKYAAALSPSEAKLVSTTGIGVLKSHIRGTIKNKSLPAFLPAATKEETLASAAPAPVEDPKVARKAEFRAALQRPRPPAARLVVTA